jgi:hypothetical protein
MKAALRTQLSRQPCVTPLRQSIHLLHVDSPLLEDEVVRAHARKPTLTRDDYLLRTIGAALPGTASSTGLLGTCTTDAKYRDFARIGSAKLRHALRSGRSLDAVRRSRTVS